MTLYASALGFVALSKRIDIVCHFRRVRCYIDTHSPRYANIGLGSLSNSTLTDQQ